MVSFHNVRDIRAKTRSGYGGSAWVELSIDMEDTVDICLYMTSESRHIASRKLTAIFKLLKEWPPDPLVEEAEAPDSPPSE